jgi:hypothetical protein
VVAKPAPHVRRFMQLWKLEGKAASAARAALPLSHAASSCWSLIRRTPTACGLPVRAFVAISNSTRFADIYAGVIAADDFANVDEHVALPVISFGKTETALVVEHFHCTSFQVFLLA